MHSNFEMLVRVCLQGLQGVRKLLVGVLLSCWRCFLFAFGG
jgi:hypothetical protein